MVRGPGDNTTSVQIGIRLAQQEASAAELRSASDALEAAGAASSSVRADLNDWSYSSADISELSRRPNMPPDQLRARCKLSATRGKAKTSEKANAPAEAKPDAPSAASSSISDADDALRQAMAALSGASSLAPCALAERVEALKQMIADAHASPALLTEARAVRERVKKVRKQQRKSAAAAEAAATAAAAAEVQAAEEAAAQRAAAEAAATRAIHELQAADTSAAIGEALTNASQHLAADATADALATAMAAAKERMEHALSDERARAKAKARCGASSWSVCARGARLVLGRRGTWRSTPCASRR
jgi:hypothetical protein